jgi:HEAT repeat protein
VIHNYVPETFVGVDHRLGWFKLGKGRHEVAFKCVGKDKQATGYNLGVNGIVLSEIKDGEVLVKATGEGLPRYEVVEDLVAARAPVPGIVYRGQPLSHYLDQLKQGRREARAEVVRAIGAFGEDAASAVDVLASALADPDAEVRAAAARALANVGAGASKTAPAVARLLKDENDRVRESATLGLRAMGKGAAVAVPDLMAALKDPAATVRMSAALALGAIGPAAESSVPAMQEAILAVNGPEISADNTQVVRNICSALGDIGPGARNAIPTLKQIKHRRIHYIAEEAIAKIQGKPIATWH